MKKFLLFTLFNAVLFNAFSQTDCQSFNGLSSIPTDWYVGGGAQIQYYEDPSNNCTADVGLQTPGVGGSNPTHVIQNTRTFSTSSPVITTSFEIFVFDANMKCTSAKNFPCVTFVKVYLVNSSFVTPNKPPAVGDIYAQSEYQIVNANGSNTITFNSLSIPDGTTYRIVYDFKGPDNCVQGNTKYVLDDVCTNQSSCGAAGGNCPPYANNDYFDASSQGFVNSLKANVLGGFAIWSTQLAASRPGYDRKSISASPAVSNGVDGDNNNHNLSTMSFALISGPTVASSTGCVGTPPVGTLTWNGDGSFEYTRGSACVSRVQFTYQITDPTSLQSNIATATIDFPVNAPLPVKLKSFNAARHQSNVDLGWVTATEQNNTGFELQRLIGAGSWQKIAFVPSKAVNGNSNADLSYTYTDINATKGVSQYRLVQTDMDAQVKYSDIRSVKGEGQSVKTIIYPNPTMDGNLKVVFEDASVLRNASLTDINGRTIKEWNNISANTLQIENLVSGMYNLRIVNRETGEQTIEKIMVNKK